jgi:hypothetical protein
MFHRLLPAFAFCLAGFPACADLALPCEVTPDTSSCSRIFACFGNKGRWFEGRGFGRGTGTFSGTVSDGVTCGGTWTNSNAVGVGQADVACDDGMTATVYYYLQDPYTGTGIGRGVTSTGEAIDSWTGENVLEFFRRGQVNSEATLKCGDKSIPIS